MKDNDIESKNRKEKYETAWLALERCKENDFGDHDANERPMLETAQQYLIALMKGSKKEG